MNTDLVVFILFLSAAVSFSIVKKKLTVGGIVVSAFMAITIYIAFSLTGILLMGTFFIAGIFATWWNRKKQYRFSSIELEQRDALQVLANGGMAWILAALAVFFTEQEPILLLMMACALSSAIADTVSSELGNIYGKRFYNILSFKKDERGENGVISFEGTLAGIIASVIMAIVYCLAVGFDVNSFIIIIAAGTIGNISDSVLGATLERNNIIGNNAVNFLNTFIAAAFGGAISY